MLETQLISTQFTKAEGMNQPKADKENRNRITKKMDTAITERVNDALWQDEVLRNMDYQDIDVHVEDQIVSLRGYVVSTLNMHRVQDAVHSIPGILGVKNTLFSDDNLTREVAGALGQLEHVYQAKFFTGVQHGVVVLNGEVSDANVRFLAEKCAANVPGVRGVINHIRTPGVEQNTDNLRFLQPTIGAQIYFRDGPSGIVKQAIINPHNRLVVAIVVQGRFSKSLEPFRFGGDREPVLTKKIVIPIREIRYLTRRSGFLNIKTLETARYEDFNPSGFISPKKDWKPPFPYALQDVLFPDEYGETIDISERETVQEQPGLPLEASLLREQATPVLNTVEEPIG